MADMAAAFYGHPSRELKLVGVTGTNGKTTTATLLYDLVRALGHKAGLISTVVYKIDERTVEATHTTPDTIRLNAMMREMVDAGCEYCFMECSSHAIVQERTRGSASRAGFSPTSPMTTSTTTRLSPPISRPSSVSSTPCPPEPLR